VLAEVCDAVQFAHSRGIIHGDIKPGNILLNQESRVKLADFGLARLMGQGRDSDSWTPMGTPEYAAPELYDKNATPDHRADIYSLGVVLHEMLTGAPPVGEFELPGEALGLDPRVDEIIARCMELNPASRYQTAQEVRDVLREIIEERNVPLPQAVKAPTKRIFRAARRTPAGVKVPPAKKRPPASQKVPPATQKKVVSGPRTEGRPAAAKSRPGKRRKVVVIESASQGGMSPEAKRAILVGAALLVIAVAVWLIVTKDGDKKDKPSDRKKDETVQAEPVSPPPSGVEPPPAVPQPPSTYTPPPPPKAETPVAVKPRQPATPKPTAAYAKIHELRLTCRDDWNKKVENKVNDELNRLTGLYGQALQKLEDEYLGKADAASVLAVREEVSRFQKTREPVKAEALSKIPALAKNQQALNAQLEKMRAAVKYDSDQVKEKYMLGLRELEKQMDNADDKEGSKIVAEEFKKVASLTNTDLRNYFNSEDGK
jgi:serine/threonine protein kinase